MRKHPDTTVIRQEPSVMHILQIGRGIVALIK